jgi:hypothetical protein
MSGFKRKPLTDDVTEALRSHTAHRPATVGQARLMEQGRGRAPKTVQINFNASEAMARIVAQEAAKVGSTRRLFARLLRDAGYDIPDADVNPMTNRRRWESSEREER